VGLCHSTAVNRPSDSNVTHNREALVLAISRAAKGDRIALREVYDRTSAKLFGLCLRILGDTSEAEDTMQEIYLTVWQRAGSFDPARSSPITWLTVIARSRAIDRLRSSGRSRASLPIENAFEVHDPSPDAVTLLEAGQDASRLNGCVEELDQRQAKAIREAFFGGMSYPQLAERAGVPVGTMKSWIRRSLIKLRECFER
jgi:RNA polymerase sigma-70 factor (ECF subfamily)